MDPHGICCLSVPRLRPQNEEMELRELTPSQLRREIAASVVVFLVALPLALGVALASGVPVALGLVSAVVGGLLVGAISGCRLQVTGPAAGLIVLVWDIVQGWGLAALGVAVLVAGALQLGAGLFRIGRLFRAVSPALIYGLLAGIGGLIVLGQLHVVLGSTPPGGGLADLVALPGAFARLGEPAVAASLGLGASTLALMWWWNAARPESLHMIPAPLVAIAGSTLAANLLSLPVAFVELPASLEDALNVPALSSFGLLLDGSFVAATLALTAIAAAESLLSASATDQLHEGARTDYDKELRALGIGNLLCGALGALPMTGVIVRSAANVEAGAKTRLPAMLHAVWLVLLVAFSPWLLALLPIPALAALLVHIGLQLVKPRVVRSLRVAGQGEVWVYAATALGIVATGLLSGLAIGFAVAMFKLLYTFSHLEVEVSREGGRVDVNLRGAATFISLPKLADTLERIPADVEAHVHIGGLMYVDHACHVMLREHERRLERGGGQLLTEWDDVAALGAPKPVIRLIETRSGRSDGAAVAASGAE
jgi:MFS superfamily sulfate permease-like transporter